MINKITNNYTYQNMSIIQKMFNNNRILLQPTTNQQHRAELSSRDKMIFVQ